MVDLIAVLIFLRPVNDCSAKHEVTDMSRVNARDVGSA